KTRPHGGPRFDFPLRSCHGAPSQCSLWRKRKPHQRRAEQRGAAGAGWAAGPRAAARWGGRAIEPSPAGAAPGLAGRPWCAAPGP
nr:hypothetical protein [Tanacetum cinerariifolium]